MSSTATINGIKIGIGLDLTPFARAAEQAGGAVKQFAGQVERMNLGLDAGSLDRSRESAHSLANALAGVTGALNLVGAANQHTLAMARGMSEMTAESDRAHSTISNFGKAAVAAALVFAPWPIKLAIGIGNVALALGGATLAVAGFGLKLAAAIGTGLPGLVLAATKGLLGITAAAGAAIYGAVILPALKASETLLAKSAQAKGVFGGSAGAVRAGADSAADSLGVTRESILGGAASLGKAGASAETASGLATAAAELAKFKGLDFEDTLSAIRTGLGGDSAALEKYGVDLKGAVTVQERATRIAAGLAGANNRLADVQRTAGQEAETNKARWHNLYASIGESIQPAFAAFTRLLGEIPRFLAGVFDSVKGPITAFSTTIAFGLSNVGATWNAFVAGLHSGAAGLLEYFARFAATIDRVFGTSFAAQLRSAADELRRWSAARQDAAASASIHNLAGRDAGQAIGPAGPTAAKSPKATKGLDELTTRLKEQIATFGQSEHAVDLYRLQQSGATDAQLADVRAMSQQLDALKATAKARDEAAASVRKYQDELQREARSVTESVLTPVEKARDAMARLNALRDAGAISDETVSRARDKIQSDLADQGDGDKFAGDKFAGALEAGSQEARTAILAARGSLGATSFSGDPQKDLVQTNKKQVTLQTDMKQALVELPEKLGALLGSALPETFSF